MSAEREYVVGARKSEWELMLATSPKTRFIAEIAEQLAKFQETRCSLCQEETVMDAATYRNAIRRGLTIVCLTCVCHAKGIPYPDTNLPPK